MDSFVLWGVAALMAVLTAWLLRKGSAVKTLTDAGLVLFLLAMMASMFLSAVIYLYFPGFVTIFELVALNMISMSLGLIPILTALFRGDKPLGETRKGSSVSSRSIVFAAVIALALLSEVFMGWTFAIVSGVASTTSQSVFSSLVESTSSYWFVFTMAAEMAVTLYLVGRGFPSSFRWLVAFQTAIMVLSPTAFANPSWAYWALWGNSGAMIVAIILIFEYLYKNRTVPAGALSYLVRLMGAYSLMMAGLFVWLLYGDAILFVLSVVAEMVVYFTIVLDEKKLAAPPLQGWLSMPTWAFGLLLSLFLAEFFMGGVLDALVNGTSYFTGLPFASLTGSALTVLGAAFYDFIVFVSSITASFLFLAMMGVEMGALVVFKIRYARETETKIRLVLLLVAYAIYSLFLPVFVLGAVLPSIPWIGWSMGIGHRRSARPRGHPGASGDLPDLWRAFLSLREQAALLPVLHGRADVSGDDHRRDEQLQQDVQARPEVPDEQDPIGLQGGGDAGLGLPACRRRALLSELGWRPQGHHFRRRHGILPLRVLLQLPVVCRLDNDPLRGDLRMRHHGGLRLGGLQPADIARGALQDKGERQRHVLQLQDEGLRKGLPRRPDRHARRVHREGGVQELQVHRSGRLRLRLPIQQRLLLRREELDPNEAQHAAAAARKSRGSRRLRGPDRLSGRAEGRGLGLSGRGQAAASDRPVIMRGQIHGRPGCRMRMSGDSR